MSRAASMVLTWAPRSPDFSSQPAQKSSWVIDELPDLPAVVRVGVAGDVGVEIAVGEAVDRAGVTGAARVEADDVVALPERRTRSSPSAWAATSVPGAPGPPGLTTIEPIRSPVAGAISSAIAIVSPTGRRSRAGTSSILHWLAPHASHASCCP